MREALKKKIIAVCSKKIENKGKDVGLSFYAFFANRNDDPELLMEAATWWIMTNKLDHFEKAELISRTPIIRKLGNHLFLIYFPELIKMGVRVAILGTFSHETLLRAIIILI